MDPVSQKVKQWMDDGRDPRSAHWQGGLEALMNVFKPYMESGRLVPVQPLAEDELTVFLAVLGVMDLSPNLTAAFLPPSVAGKIVPPESADDLKRIEKDQPSYKILVARPGKEPRILCAEISAHAKNIGIDIFQSGALLGTYNFENQQDCFAQFAKILRTHLWEKDKWSRDDHVRYTVNWFSKVLDLNNGDVNVEKDFSFFHSPTLIRSNRIDAIFILIYEIIQQYIKDTAHSLHDSVKAIRKMYDPDTQKVQMKALIGNMVLDFLAVMKDCDLVQFEGFSEKERKQFKQESAGTIQKIVRQLGA